MRERIWEAAFHAPGARTYPAALNRKAKTYRTPYTSRKYQDLSHKGSDSNLIG